uniref:Uncharacterized protein n=1 Tax=Candidatus Kentrum eta TaxID=2126337 RepID=A0A450VAS7_9GAMM|nr:MAG: hypothetical protein BECKH772A_GA0070896_100776 [Candidatus Kentron sp. H]VFJ95644.1 MAG: hypothetical protein BECKH772B_GA0070898_100796 [Candidatus Kentron sp. H]VFK01883.1 MAG: hypothetical protein BECKH772C_GA0070978_100756 [Candidatus Kentron sp. H]
MISHGEILYPMTWTPCMTDPMGKPTRGRQHPITGLPKIAPDFPLSVERGASPAE